MNDINSKRAFVIQMYPNKPRWRNRVNQMPDHQIVAIYMKEQEKQAAQTKSETKTETNDDIPF
jgi:hypothetical protein